VNLPAGLDPDRYVRLVEMARHEDLGTHGDVTTALLPEPHRTAQGRWELRARAAGRFCGVELLDALLEQLAPETRISEWLVDHDGAAVQPGAVIVRLSGLVVQMLAAERTVLNFLQRLSGVATLTHRYVDAVRGTHAKIYDTRKTLPGWRDLDRYAVRAGGGHNHRRGLYDAVLIKDNHLSGVPLPRLAHAVFDMLNRMQSLPAAPRFVEVEAASAAEAQELFKVIGLDVIMLDNFSPDELRQAVALRDRQGLRGKVELEASGGITLENVAEYAQTGVERIAVGAITHSAVALDMGLDAVEGG